ncbi:MAG: hypothetical protein H6648_09260 [Caldilineae bacterium]|nr:hypothetical protein [Chloroflexota bacterium]MCB9177336.1 hypothetical protein [Caldilineae bacterium]
MASARAAHSASALPDGRVLLVGGFTQQENSAAGAELYDPITAAFIAAGPMGTPRHSHSATLLADGRVLVAGGYDARGNTLRSTELYDPASGSFGPAASMGLARADHEAVRLDDGRVLIVGGVGPGWTFLASAELYDPVRDRFEPTGAMDAARESHAALRLRDGRVLVVGGHLGRGAATQIHRSAEIYDSERGGFAPAGDMMLPRHKHDALLLSDGRVLVSGGSDARDSDGVYASAELYDPAGDRFSAIDASPLPRYKHQGTSWLLPDGRVLLAGGATRAELFDPRTGGFTRVGGAARLAGQFSASAPLPDGRVLITGGYGERQGPQRDAWIFQP